MRLLITCLLLLVSASSQQAADSYGTFDHPIDKKIVDFGPSPYYPPDRANEVRKRLTCFVFSDFIIKEYDEGQKGAEWHAIVPVKQGKVTCSLSRSTDELRIPGKTWSGYFKGAKGQYVFFDADDGFNGGLSFVVYDSRTQRKVFQDSASLQESDQFSATSQQGTVTLSYRRVVVTHCDLRTEAGNCWQKLQKKFGIQEHAPPVCSGYEEIKERYESAIAYPVKVVLKPGTVPIPANGKLSCWPVD